MSADEFRAAIAALGISQQGFAKLVGASPRTGQKWGLGEARVPGSVAVLLRLLLARPELMAVLADVTPPVVRKRSGARVGDHSSGGVVTHQKGHPLVK